MNKILLIIKREYLTRVKKKSFIIMSLLSPFLFAAMIIIPTWLNTQEDTKEKIIAVQDLSGLYTNTFHDSPYIKYTEFSDNHTKSNQDIIERGYDAVLVINGNLLQNPSDIAVYSDGQLTFSVLENIRSQINNRIKEDLLNSFQIDGFKEKMTKLNQTKVDIQTIRVDENGKEKQNNASFAMIIGMVSAMIIYIFMLMYGTQVMKGVIEEKTNRIVEVIICSVKPFQLMMGKIIGIGMVALTQFGIWVFLTLTITGSIQSTFTTAIHAQQIEVQSQQDQINYQTENNQKEEAIKQLTDSIMNTDMIGIIGFFLFYFIGGYLLYSTLFAAIGSAIDNETETQQFIMPILIPLILSIWVATSVFRNPHGSIAFWFSLIPFTSPVVMMSRIPFDVPTWQIITSMGILVLSFVAFTWFAARVYRTGILMYGKKVSYKEIWKWFKYAGK